MKKYLILFIFLSGSFSLVGFEIWREHQFHYLLVHEKLEFLWQKDLNKLTQSKVLPKNWGQIQKIEFMSTDELTKEVAEQIKAPIKVNKQGTHKLEILFLSWEEPKDPSKLNFIIQYDLVDIKSKNLEWELGRTFRFRKN